MNVDIETVQSLVGQWHKASQDLKKLKAAERKLRDQLSAVLDLHPDTSKNGLDIGFDCTLVRQTPTLTKVDTAAVLAHLSEIRQAGLNPYKVFDWELKLVAKDYKNLTDDHRAIVDYFLTTKPGAPQLEIKKRETSLWDS